MSGTPPLANTELTPRERYAQEFEELSTPDLIAMKDFLGAAIGKIEDFSFDNTAHVDLRNRFLGSTLALRGRVIEEPTVSGEKPDPDDTPPSYMLRVDGGVDVVSAAGVKVFEKSGNVPQDQVQHTFPSKTPPAASKPKASAPHNTTFSTRNRRVII